MDCLKMITSSFSINWLILVVLMMKTCSTAPCNDNQKDAAQTVEKRDLFNLFPELHPTTQPPIATEEVISYSGDSPKITDVLFNATLVDDVPLSAMRLPSPSIKYNYIRIGSVTNINSESDDTTNHVDLQDGIFRSPIKGVYRITFRVHVNVYDTPIDGIVGATLCLNDICDGTLDKTVMYSYMTAVCGNRQVLQIVGNIELERNDSIKFFVFKSSDVGLNLLKETTMFGQTM